MRNLLLSACLTFSISILFAQVPQAIKYQAVARDSSGSILANANITVRISILDSAAGGSVAYSEVHKTGTNQFGLFNISIGRGIQPNGLFANIDWATGSKWMQLEMSQNDGTTFTLIGASEMLSVPYALYAETTHTQVNSSVFNPLYPDGTDGMISVSQVITDSTPYIVPAGKNLYINTIRTDDIASRAVINGIEFLPYNAADNYPFLIMGAGDSIYSSTFWEMILGYLIDANVTSVNVNLKDSSYVVPTGKEFFLTYWLSPKDPSTPKILINGVAAYNNVASLPILLKSGDIISISPIPVTDSYLNGYLK